MTHRQRTRFAETVRWYRRLSGYTQRDLAATSGLSLAAIRSYETGARNEPRAHSLKQLATALGVTIEQLLTETHPPEAVPPYAVYHRPHIDSRLDEKHRS